MSSDTTGGTSLLPSVVFLHDGEVSAELDRALIRLRSNSQIAFTEIAANSVSCECFQRVRVPALILYNEDGAEVASAVGAQRIIALIEQQFL